MEFIPFDQLLALTDLRILRIYLQYMYPSNHSYTAEQIEQLRLHYLKLNGTVIDKDYAERQIGMAIIFIMDEPTFIKAIYNDRLPQFICANQFDPDYSNAPPQRISSDLYDKREALRYYPRERFIERTLNDVSYANYKTRKEAMCKIMEMEMDEFLTGLNAGKLPEFVRAEYGDPDYCILRRTPQFSNRDEFAYFVRDRLSTMSIDDFETHILHP